jgi:hypothetical protein
LTQLSRSIAETFRKLRKISHSPTHSPFPTEKQLITINDAQQLDSIYYWHGSKQYCFTTKFVNIEKRAKKISKGGDFWLVVVEGRKWGVFWQSGVFVLFWGIFGGKSVRRSDCTAFSLFSAYIYTSEEFLRGRLSEFTILG